MITAKEARELYSHSMTKENEWLESYFTRVIRETSEQGKVSNLFFIPATMDIQYIYKKMVDLGFNCDFKDYTDDGAFINVSW